MKANADSWKRDPFVEGGEILPLQLEISPEQMERIKYGFIPQEMEDKWFAYYEEPFIYMHRSWTGMPVYRVEFGMSDSSIVVKEARLSKGYQGGNLRFEADLAHHLLTGLMGAP